MRKLFVLGLDCAPPRILYENYGVELDALREVIDESARYVLESCHPPITIPAWISMFTGKTPGELGIYGFRHRKPGDVRESYIVNSTHIKYPTLWDIAGRKGYRVGVIGVPPTYPPKPVHGFMITDFTTPGPEKPYTFPPWLKRELEKNFGPYIFDIVYRSHEKDRVAKELFEMTKQHLAIVKYLLSRKPWDLFIYVEVGVDRAHHAFWKYFDKEHPRYTIHENYSKVIPEYYKLIDEWFNEIRKLLPKDTIIVIVSDHGVKAMKGAFVINQWLQEQGYLKLKEKPQKPGQDLDINMIDWNHTIAWGWGGYYARVFINLKGREPHGIVEKKYYEETIRQLKNDFEKIRGPNGEQWDNKVYTPRELYPEVKGDPPDLIVYFDNLSWRSAGTLGWKTIYLPQNDRGPDDAVHDWYGVFAIYEPEGSINKGDKGKIKINNIFDILNNIIQS
ncbi:MAG: nucleotide pyrophosphatase [Thermoprotei archaeon]|nr:MAG: nucleotide pyrophosphatase [Thermoprotei archaeon]